MATVRDSGGSALIVVDVQAGVLRDAWEAPRMMARVAHAVAVARAQSAPVIWVQHADEQLVRGSAEWQWAGDFSPRDDEPVIHKHFESAFEQTSLEPTLADRRVSRIVLCGASTNWCIRATAYAALDRGYDLTLVHDAHTTSSMQTDGGFRIEADQVVRELNAVMQWIRYPGRQCDTAAAEGLSFG